MVGFKRFMAYLYRYEEGEKKENCGFAKVTIKNEGGRIAFHLKLPKQDIPFTYQIYLYYRKEDKIKMHGIWIGELAAQSGQNEVGISFPSIHLGRENRDFSDMGGIYLETKEGSVVATEWDDIPVKPEDFLIENEENEDGRNEEDEVSKSEVEVLEEIKGEQKEIEPALTEEIKEREDRKSEVLCVQSVAVSLEPPAEKILKEETIEPVHTCRAGQEVQCPYQGKVEQEPEKPNRESLGGMAAIFDKWAQLKAKYPIVSPFDEENEITCIRIQPKDICLLNRREWILGNNNFLLHGYCNYRYLLLGKKEEDYIIFVPGNYYSKEKMMASMFGFPEFKMAGSGPLRQGEFGYWCRKVSLY